MIFFLSIFLGAYVKKAFESNYVCIVYLLMLFNISIFLLLFLLIKDIDCSQKRPCGAQGRKKCEEIFGNLLENTGSREFENYGKECFGGLGFTECTHVGDSPELTNVGDEWNTIYDPGKKYCIDCCGSNRSPKR